jgi:hypothetical protein
LKKKLYTPEDVVVFRSENPLVHKFIGKRELKWGSHASELTHFRKRIGTRGAEDGGCPVREVDQMRTGTGVQYPKITLWRNASAHLCLQN